ncbi:DUF4238 domain-containing protein [Phytohabitans sp. LJ34]|uniref:DUF4238 domain-containing protein n=1 Tax=Phytohabitans sp. LJ34 TaxID=3452217 RepID=UPI003F89C0CE
MPNIARRHHTVPRFYLERFSEDGRIGTVRLPGDQRFVQSVKNAATNNNFYSLDTTEPKDADLFERSLGRMERVASVALRAVIERDVWPLDSEERTALGVFAATQALRGPNQRRHMEQIVAATTRIELGVGGRDSVFAYAKDKLGREITEEEADRLWADVTQPGGPPIRLSSLGHIEQLLRVLPEILPYFLGRPWVLVRFQRRRLCTCDTPIALIPHADRSPGSGVGLLTAWGITFPLSRDVGLLMADPSPLFGHITLDAVAEGRVDSRQPGTVQLADLFNNATINNARMWIFHHPEDRALLNRDLPEPREVEIEVLGADPVEMGENLRRKQEATRSMALLTPDCGR